MSVRTSLSELIGRVRTLIADPAGASAVFDDAAIQEALDRRRVDVRYERLTPRETFAPGGVLHYRDFYSAQDHWEADVVLQGLDWATLTPDSPEPLVGHWAFVADQGLVVYATGKAHDPYGAAADLLRAWAAREKLSFDFTSSQQQQFMRSQKVTQLLQMASAYDRQAKPLTATLVRGDEARGLDGADLPIARGDYFPPWGR